MDDRDFWLALLIMPVAGKVLLGVRLLVVEAKVNG